jgi:hypothetical protein
MAGFALTPEVHGVVRTSPTTLNGRCYQNLDAFAPAIEWDGRVCESIGENNRNGNADDL